MDADEFPPVTPLARWRRSTASGVVLTGIAMGLRDALELPKDPPAIVQSVAGGPGPDDPIDLHLDPEHPEETVAVIRPWLIGPR